MRYCMNNNHFLSRSQNICEHSVVGVAHKKTQYLLLSLNLLCTMIARLFSCCDALMHLLSFVAFACCARLWHSLVAFACCVSSLLHSLSTQVSSETDRPTATTVASTKTKPRLNGRQLRRYQDTTANTIMDYMNTVI
jgi:hypothetical protein